MKIWNKKLGFAAMLLAACVAVTAAPARAEEALQLTEENIPEVDITRGMKLPLNGYLSQDIEVGETTRTVKIYVGENAPVRTYMTWINVPDGVDTYQFLQETGWAALADERGEGIFVLEPGEGGWGTAEEEQEYLAAAFGAYNTRKWYSNYSESYMVGYGKGGSALQMFAMSRPTAFIAGTFVDADEISADFMASNAAEANDAQTTILRGTIPMPVWEIGAGEEVVNYWLAANHCTEAGVEEDGATVYTQSEECQQTSYTKGVYAKVKVQETVDNARTAEFTRAAYTWMSEYTKYENNWAEGNALMLRPDYEKMGVKFVDFDQDGYAREYLVYVPESAPEENIPVVYVMPGNTQTVRVFFDCTDWWQVADDYGFMIVIPSEQFNTAVDLTWNITDYFSGSATATADDVGFLKAIMEEVAANYAIDPGRVYVTGQSFGSMWTNYLALFMSDAFTAFGSTSGPIPAGTEGSDTEPVPFWLMAGEHDIFSADYTVDAEKGFNLKDTVEYYLQRNGLGTVKDAEITVDGRYTTSTWKNADGIPMYKFTVTAGRNHNCIPAEPRILWEQWFSCWTKGEDGVRVYTPAE